MISISVPWPPSNNHLYATYRGRRLLSKEGRHYHQRIHVLCRMMLKNAVPLNGRIRLCLTAHPPDRRTRDLSNLTKALEDALTKAGVWGDDGQIDDLRIVRAEVEKDGRIAVEIEEIA